MSDPEALNAGWRLACRCRVDGTARVELAGGVNQRILTEGGGQTIEGAQGVMAAVDIGTTTIAAYLVRDGATIDCEAAMNPQRSVGADVISRVDYVINHEDGLRFLSGQVRARVDELIARMTARQGIAPEEVRLVSLVGNPIMTHILAGVDPRAIAVAPTNPPTGRRFTPGACWRARRVPASWWGAAWPDTWAPTPSPRRWPRTWIGRTRWRCFSTSAPTAKSRWAGGGGC
jgi:hypothetical protein